MEQQIIAARCKAFVEPLSEELLHGFHARGYTPPLPRGTHAVGRKRDRVRGISYFIRYAANKNLAPLVREIGWTHNILIFGRCKDDLQREFNIRMTRKFGWSKNVLIHHIENQRYEKTLLGQTNKIKTKDRVIVEYALKNSAKPIGVGAYRVVNKLPKVLKGQLPTPGQIERLLRDEAGN